MEDKLEIFCDYEFLRKFYKSCPQDSNVEERNLLGYWKNFDELLCKNSNLFILGIDDTEFSNSEDGTDWDSALESLRSKRYSSEGELVCLPREKTDIEKIIEDDKGISYFGHKDKENTIFLFDNSADYCTQMENDFGLMFISSENFLQKYFFLFSSSIISINSSDNTKDWKFLSRFKHPCNSIKIIDKYLFKDPVSENIYDILMALMPKKLNKNKFTIKIITSASDYDETTKNKRRNELKEIIKKLKIRLSYEIAHEINFVSGKLHDRYLLTNYSIITCGYGFNLKEGERKMGTHLSFFPITYLQMPNYGYYDDCESITKSGNQVFKLMKKIGELK